MNDIDKPTEPAALLARELQRRGITHRDLAQRLTQLGVPTTEREIAERISGAALTASLFAQCCEAMGAPVINLDF